MTTTTEAPADIFDALSANERRAMEDDWRTYRVMAEDVATGKQPQKKKLDDFSALLTRRGLNAETFKADVELLQAVKMYQDRFDRGLAQRLTDITKEELKAKADEAEALKALANARQRQQALPHERDRILYDRRLLGAMQLANPRIFIRKDVGSMPTGPTRSMEEVIQQIEQPALRGNGGWAAGVAAPREF